jgi:hypothetical protein
VIGNLNDPEDDNILGKISRLKKKKKEVQ